MQTGAVFPGKIGRSKLLKTHDFSSALVPGQTYRFSGSSDLSSGQTQEPDSASSDLQQTHEPESVSSELVSGRNQRPAGSGSSDLALGQTQDTVSHTSSDSSTTNWVVQLGSIAGSHTGIPNIGHMNTFDVQYLFQKPPCTVLDIFWGNILVAITMHPIISYIYVSVIWKKLSS